MSTNPRSQYDGSQAFFEIGTGAPAPPSPAPLWPTCFYDDFVGAGAALIPAAGAPVVGCPWVKKIVGAAPPTLLAVANARNGQIAAALTSTSEKEEATVYFGDQLTFDITLGPVFESVASLSVLPSLAGVQAVLGLSSAWIDGPDNAAAYLEFGASGSGDVFIRSYDGVTRNAIDTGWSLIAGQQHLFTIDARTPSDVRFFINGLVANQPGSVSFGATGATAVLQPYFSVYKPNGTGVATLIVDSVRVASNRGAA